MIEHPIKEPGGDPPTCPKCDSQNVDTYVDFDGEKEVLIIYCNERGCEEDEGK